MVQAICREEIAIGAGDLQVQGFKIFFIKREICMLRMHAFFFFCDASTTGALFLGEILLGVALSSAESSSTMDRRVLRFGVVSEIWSGLWGGLGASKRRDLARVDLRICRVCGVSGVTAGEDLGLDLDRSLGLEGV